MFKYYQCEKVVKYHLVKENLNTEDEITIFEMPINNSRLDIGKINGSSHIYEIKTKYDSLTKLEKQIEDYSKAFEYINIVVHPKHEEKALELIPLHCGLLSYDEEFHFHEIKESTISPHIDVSTQLSTLSSHDLGYIIKTMGIGKPHNTKAERLACINSECSDEEIRELYKTALKEKFRRRWQFLRQSFDDILPVDVQVFYQTLADPYWTYFINYE